jgi:hypothetical protein
MNKKQTWIVFFALAFLTVLVRLPSLIEPLDNDGGEIAYHARYIIRGEPLYGSHHPDHQLPGIYYTVALIFKLFGDHQVNLKLFLFPLIFACAWLLFLMGRSYVNDLTGVLGAVFYILVSAQVLLTGMMLKREPIANLPLTGGVLLTIILLHKNAPPRRFIWVGLLGAICILDKVIFVTPLVVAGVGILAIAWLERQQQGSLKTAVLRLAWMSIGLIIPLAATGAYFASLGLWDRLMLVFTLGVTWLNQTDQMSAAGMPRPFGFPLFWMGVNNIVLLIFGLLGTYRFARRAFPLRTTKQVIDLVFVLWLIISFALAGLRGGGYPYYVLLVVPSLAFMGAAEIGEAYQRWQAATAGKAPIIMTGFLIALVVGNFAWVNLDLYSHYISYRLGDSSYKDFLYGYKGTGPRSWNAQIIADYIADRTSPDDLIYVWSTDAQIYYFSDRKLPVDILWPVYISVSGPPERIFTPQTKYIIVDMPERLARPEWLMNGLARDYQLETTLAEKDIYRRNSP